MSKCCCFVFSSHLLAAVPLFKARRALHFAVYLEDYSVLSVQLEPTGVTQERVNTGAFFFFYLSFLPHRSPAVLAFILYREKVRLSPSLVNTKVEVVPENTILQMNP